MIIKAEWSAKGSNVRFVVTNLSYNPENLYEFYIQRGGTCEVRIDELPKVGSVREEWADGRQVKLSQVYCQSVQVVFARRCVLFSTEITLRIGEDGVLFHADTAASSQDA